MTEACQDLRRKAVKCRRLAESIDDPKTVEALKALAREYEVEAEALDARPARPPNPAA